MSAIWAFACDGVDIEGAGMWLTPLPASPARGEVFRSSCLSTERPTSSISTSPLAGEAGRGGEPRALVHPARINWIAVSFLNR